MQVVARRRLKSDSSIEGRSFRMGDDAYARILETLFDRKIPAGAFLSQNDLVKLLGVPIAPLREALKFLEAEGIVVIHPRSGIQFVKPGLELTRSTFQFRIILERSAAMAYAQTADDFELAEIERRHVLAIQTIERDGLTPSVVEEVEALEFLIHLAIIRSLSNPLIESSYKRLHNYVRLIRLNRRVTGADRPAVVARTLQSSWLHAKPTIPRRQHRLHKLISPPHCSEV